MFGAKGPAYGAVNPPDFLPMCTYYFLLSMSPFLFSLCASGRLPLFVFCYIHYYLIDFCFNYFLQFLTLPFVCMTSLVVGGGL